MSTLQVDRIEPYQSASVQIVGLDIDTTALNQFTASQEQLNTTFATTASLNSYTASQEQLNTTFATTGSNIFFGNQDINGDLNLDYGVTQRRINVGVSGSTGYSIQGFDFEGKAYGQIFSQAPGGFMIKDGSSTPNSTLNLNSDSGSIYNFAEAAGKIWRAETQNGQMTLFGNGAFQIAALGTGSVFAGGLDNNYGLNLYKTVTFDKDTGIALDMTTTGAPINKIGIYSNFGGPGYQSIMSWQDASNYTDGALEVHQILSGSKVTLSETLTLEPQDPLPSGSIGELAVSGSALYFYDGAWKTVSLV
jgi:hypothetical protein